MNKKISILLCSFIMTSSLISSENKKKDSSGKWSLPPAQVVVKSHKPKGPSFFDFLLSWPSKKRVDKKI